MVSKQDQLMKQMMKEAEKQIENEEVEVPVQKEALKKFFGACVVIVILLGIGTLFFAFVE